MHISKYSDTDELGERRNIEIFHSCLLVNVQPLVRVSNLIGAQHCKAQSL